MTVFDVLSLVGGLALFLYGMDVMGDGLKKLAGGRLEMFLGKMTSNRIKGFLLGFIVTAVIQSSSATTVMLVGFVNSGIMTLGQSISVIMGANIGTTVTSWLLSLTGIGEGASVILKLFKPSSFTPVLAVIGVIMIMAGKNDKKKNIGTILIGFAVLMFGMDAMSAAMDGLKDSESFAEILVMFSNPVLGIITGTLLTAIIQSSSASVGILQAMALTGAIPYSTAIPIILGQNIGTTITPILSAISGNKEAKRVAVSCLYIKMIGVVVVSVAFYVLHAVIGFAFMDAHVTPLAIAMTHTLFNILSTVILLPCCSLLEKLAVVTIKDKGEKEEVSEFDTLDERFFEMPAFAVEKCREMVSKMAKEAKKGMFDATTLLSEYNTDMVEDILKSEKKVDKYEDKISTYLVKLAEMQLSTKDSGEVTKLLHVIGDVERISDHSVNILEVAQEVTEKNIEFSDRAKHDIGVITNAVCEVITIATDALVNQDLEMAKRVEPLEQIIDKLKRKIKNNHIIRLKDGDCTVELGFILSDLLNNYERVADHCSNIAVCLLEMENNSFETHEYLNHVKNDGENKFFEQYDIYKKKYSL